MTYFIRKRGSVWEIVRRTWLLDQVIAYALTERGAKNVMTFHATKDNQNGQ